MREVISGTGSKFFFCRLSQTKQQYSKYPPQPVVRCGGYKSHSREVNSLPNDISKPTPLCLDQFLKLASIAESGGQAKVMIQGGKVKVNGEIETRRRRKLVVEDVIEAGGQNWLVKDFVSLEG
jgi:ribosome-associated protein